MSTKKIMVATDFSDTADLATKQAIGIARHLNAEVCLIYAGTVPQAPMGLPKSLTPIVSEYKRILDSRFADTRKELDEMRQQISGQGATVSQLVVDGFPDQVIPKAAVEQKVDMLVVGSHGRTGVRRILMGSVAERIVRSFEGNTMIARGTSTCDGGFKRILVPVDFSEYSIPAVQAAIELVHNEGSIELFHGWQLPAATWLDDGWGSRWSELNDAVDEANRKLGDDLVAKFADKTSAQVSFSQTSGAPGAAIQKRLGESDYDLVVVGSHGRQGPKRWVLGSVAEVTVRHAPCSALVVHLPK